MLIQKDFAEFLNLLNENKVKYVIVGGYAVAFYGYVRVTKDLDILFENSVANIRRLKKTLAAFGFPAGSLEGTAFSEHGKIIRMGISPTMIELINKISGVSFAKAWKNRISGDYGNVKVNFISKTDLLRNKKTAARPGDLVDVTELKSIR